VNAAARHQSRFTAGHAQPDDPYAEDRAVYAAAYRAVIDAILDALAASRSHGPRPELLGATRHMVDCLVTVLALHDRITRRTEELGADPEAVCWLGEGRAELVMHLQRARDQVQQLEQRGEAQT